MDLKKVLLTVGILVSSLSNVCHADLPFKKYSFFQNYGGLNDSLSQLDIKDNEATALQNVVFDTAGTVSKRYGYSNVNSGQAQQVISNSSAITGLSYYINQSTGNKYIVAVANVTGNAYVFQKQLDTSGNIPNGAWTQIGHSGLPTNYTNDYLPTLTQANNILVFTFPASTGWKPYAWQATSNVYKFTQDPNCPNATMSAYFNNILFLAGDPANPNRVTFSDLTNGITSFVATDFFLLNQNDGHYITALIPAFGNLYILEDNSIWMLTGSSRDTFSLQRMVDNVGTLSNHSVSIINNNIFFITSQNDIAVYDGNFTIKYISSKIRNTIGANNFNRASQALGIAFSSYKYKDLDYYVTETTNGQNTNNQVLEFDTDRESWTKFTNITPNAWTIIPNSNGLNNLIFGDYNGLVYSYPNIGTYNDVSNSCGSNNNCITTSPSIYSSYSTKWFTFSDSSLGNKYLRILKTYIQNSSLSSTLTTQVNFDYSSNGKVYTFVYTPSGAKWGSAIWGTDVWGTTQALNIDREEPNEGTQMFQLIYSNNNSNEDMNILGFDIFVEPTTQL